MSTLEELARLRHRVHRLEEKLNAKDRELRDLKAVVSRLENQLNKGYPGHD